eukprot:TRINITY_DN55685_c0_g1_i1.p1 TRINITY_DN55685_c0_g1~~TRINITY_DN55685_c0_g1_i1.p1  ORF type:complete len:566 (+),score=93.45 TRINITY_DN55685_c0_g1_i1:61-1698(+)
MPPTFQLANPFGSSIATKYSLSGTTMNLLFLAIISSTIQFGFADDTLQCGNPLVVGDRMWPAPPVDGWRVAGASITQRHWDRWLYVHPLVKNFCWPYQLNSSAPELTAQCDYNISTPWEVFDHVADPYSRPLHGSCAPTQLLAVGKSHAYALGQQYRMAYARLLDACHHIVTRPPGDDINADMIDITVPWGQCIGLSTIAGQRTEATLAETFAGITGGEDTSDDAMYTAARVVDDGTVARGRPFWLSAGDVCTTDGTLQRDIDAAKTAMLNSTYWNTVVAAAAEMAAATEHQVPTRTNAAVLLDNVEDCAVVHKCAGIGDVPPEVLTHLREADVLETASRVWPLRWFAQTPRPNSAVNASAANASAVNAKVAAPVGSAFARRYYGYFLTVISDRLAAAAANAGWPVTFTADTVRDWGAWGGRDGDHSGNVHIGRRRGAAEQENKKGQVVHLDVVSDSNLSPLLVMLGFDDAARRRPPYGSSLIFEVWVPPPTASDEPSARPMVPHVSIAFSGERLAFWTWAEWAATVSAYQPSPEECPAFHSHYL